MNLCDLLRHQKVLFTSVELNKYLMQIRDTKKLALPFFISNFGSILLGHLVQVHIILVENELFIEMVVPFTERDLFLLYEMPPFPVFQANLQDKTLAAYVQPRADYIAVADSSDRYLFLNQTDLKKCNERNTFFLCENEFYFESFMTCEKMLLSKPDYGEFSLCNIHFLQGKEQYFTRMTNRRLWLASALNRQRLEVKCSGNLYKMPISGSQIVELPKNCKMRIEEREVYGFDGRYDEQDIIVPNIKLNVRREIMYKVTNEKQSNNNFIEARSAITTKDVLYIVFYVFLSIIIIAFLAIFTYLAFRLLAIRDRRTTVEENAYVPMYPLDRSFKCNFKGMSHYEEPRIPPLPLLNNEPSTSTTTV